MNAGTFAWANLIVMTPIMARTGAVVGGLWRVLSNSFLNVFSFVSIDSLFAHLRKKQLDAEKALEELKRELETSAQPQELQTQIAEQEQIAKKADAQHMNWRTFYYGGIHPAIKNSHLIGEGPTRYVLLAIGTTGFLVDGLKNGVRFSSQLHLKTTAPAPGTEPASCHLRILVVPKNRINTVRDLFALPPVD
jgi:hypothetical protein